MGKQIFKGLQTAAKAFAVGAGLAIAGFGVALVKSLIDTEAELRPMVERSRIAAESLQVLAEAATRAGSEDGLEAIVDASQELQLQLGELALTGNARAVPALNALGLSSEKLQGMLPEEALRSVIAEIQKIPNVANRAIAAEEIFGGVSEKLSGIVNLTAAEFANLEKNVRATTDIWSQDALDAAKEFDEGLKEMKAAITSVVTPIIAALLPTLTRWARWVTANRPQIVKFFEDVKNAVTPFVSAFITGIKTIMPPLISFAKFIFNNKPLLIAAIAAIGFAIVSALGPVSTAVLAITALITLIGFLRDNWSEIMEAIQRIWQRVSAAIKRVYDSNFAWLLPGGPLIKAIMFFRDNWRAIWDAVMRIWNRISATVKRAYESNFGWLLPAGPLIKAILFFKDNWRSVWDAVKGVIQGAGRIIERIGNTISRIISTITNAVSRARGALSSVQGIASTVSSVTSTIGNVVSRIPKLQTGGSVTRGGVVDVHKNERIFLPRGAEVQRAGAGGGGGMTINVYGDINDAEAFYRKVNEARTRFGRRGN